MISAFLAHSAVFPVDPRRSDPADPDFARPEGFGPLWLVLLTLVVFQCIRSQKRIAAVQGELRLLADRRFSWHGREWRLAKTVDAGLRHAADAAADGGQKRRRLWLASDCMSKEEWRHLRQLLLYPPTGDGEPE